MRLEDSSELQNYLFSMYGNRIRNAIPLCFQNFQSDYTIEQIINLINCEDALSRNRLLMEYGQLELTRLFSHLRTNLFSWIKFETTDSVLLVGEEAGIFVESIANNVQEVVCVETSAFSALLAAARTNHIKNIDILYGDVESCLPFLESKKFKYILFVDNQVINKTLPLSLNDLMKNIEICQKFLKIDGSIMFSSDNALGLKFWSGCKDNISGNFFTGIENYATTNYIGHLDYSDINRIINTINFKNHMIYYPYPDYWFPISIYSDEYLPQKNELSKNAFSWEDRLSLFNEVNVWNSIIKNKLFPQMSNSYLVVLSNQDFLSDGLNIFTKFSNDRGQEFSIRTDIYYDKDRHKHVKKVPLTYGGKQHLDQMCCWEKELKDIFQNTKIEINKIVDKNEGLEFEYLEGSPLLEKLNDSLDNDNFEEFLNIFRMLTDILIEKSHDTFEVTPEFIKRFGNVSLPKNLKCCKVNDVDLIVQNVIIVNDNLTIIDYEWTFGFPIPVNYIIYRSIVFFFRGPRGSFNYNRLYQTKLFDIYGIDDEQCTAFAKMETNFQKFICGSYFPLREIGLRHPKAIRPRSPQVYFDYGKGFSAINSYCVQEQLNGIGVIQFRIGLTENIRKVRVDPSTKPCIVRVFEISCGGREKYIPLYKTNGFEICENIYLFNTNDSQVILPTIKENTMFIDVCMEILNIDEEISDAFSKNVFRGRK